MSSISENTPSVMDEEEMLNEAPLKESVKTPLIIDEVLPATPPSEDEVLAYTHHYRKEVVRSLTANGQIPGDGEDRKLLLQTLDGMDRQALSRKRMSIDKEVAQGAASANAAVLAELIKTISPRAPQLTTTRSIPVFVDDGEPLDVVEGETNKQVPQDTYASFMARHAKPSE